MADRSTTTVGWNLPSRARLGGNPFPSRMARSDCWAFPMSKKDDCFSKPSYKSSRRSSIRTSRNRVSVFDQNVLLGQAAKQVQDHIRAGYRHCVDMDLSKFFDRVQHDVLLVRVARKVRDKRLLRLIGRYLRAGVMVDADLQPSIEGTMQGGPLSPLLANILLDDFDKELERRGLRFVRYADDFLVFTKTSEAARRVFASVGRYLTRKLKLVVNRQKSRICSTDGVEFLGFIFDGLRRSDSRQPEEHLRSSRIASARSRVAIAACRWRVGTKNFAGISRAGWATSVSCRSRVSSASWTSGSAAASGCCYWKQWRRPRTRIANLRKLGIREHEAVTHGISSKGPWVMSSSQAVHEALSMDYLREQGLASLLEIWNKLAAKERTA